MHALHDWQPTPPHPTEEWETWNPAKFLPFYFVKEKELEWKIKHDNKEIFIVYSTLIVKQK